jgi:phospholipid/cholesterol/gamma-HCH transport system substrate-binding protein
MRGVRLPTVVATAALVMAVAITAIVVAGGAGGQYVVRAQFRDGGQLVKGNTVQVAGRNVGEVTAIELTPDGLADVVMRLDDDSVKPLHQGTRAAISTVGLSGVANRFVELTPGPPTTPRIADDGVIPLTRTRGVVDLDALLNTVDEDVRADIRGIVEDMAVALTPRTARQTNAGLQMLNPAVSRLTAVGREITRDKAALESLLQRAASVGSVLSRRRDALGTGIEATADTLSAVASERRALGETLERAPGALETTTRTLRRVRERTLPAVDPLVRAAGPAVGPLDGLLREVEPTLDDALPLVRRMRALMPDARAALEPLPELKRRAAPALASGTKALGDALPMITGLRPYTPELVAGLFLGFGGSTAGYYDANGHYARVHLMGGPGSLPGLSPRPQGERMDGYRTGVDARCPGAAEEPAPDGSNPWHDGAGAACDPSDDHG